MDELVKLVRREIPDIRFSEYGLRKVLSESRSSVVIEIKSKGRTQARILEALARSAATRKEIEYTYAHYWPLISSFGANSEPISRQLLARCDSVSCPDQGILPRHNMRHPNELQQDMVLLAASTAV